MAVNGFQLLLHNTLLFLDRLLHFPLLFSFDMLLFPALLLLERMFSLYLVLQIQVQIHFWFLLARLQQLLLHFLQSFLLFLVNEFKFLLGSILQVFLKVFILLDLSLLHVFLYCLAVILALVLQNCLLDWLISLLILYLSRQINGFWVDFSDCLWKFWAFFLWLLSEDYSLAYFPFLCPWIS